jgi:hypothetical protein
VILTALGLGLVVLAGLASRHQAPPPADDLCRVFAERPDWLRAARRTAREWQVTEAVQMAFIRQESGFRAPARPPRRRWWILPGPRPSTAFGYAQALDATWDEYRRSHGKWGARRDRFADAADFVGWHVHRLHRELGLEKSDARQLYLAYHEGARGFRERRYEEKPQVMRAASRVAALASSYAGQYEVCGTFLHRRQQLAYAARIAGALGLVLLLGYAVWGQQRRQRRLTRRL